VEADFWGDSILRNRPPHYSRDLRRRRIKRDPEYARQLEANTKRYQVEKTKRCPQYAEVMRLTHRLHNLREKVKRRTLAVVQAERELIATAKRYNILRERCKGK